MSGSRDRAELPTSLRLHRWLSEDPAWKSRPWSWRAMQRWLATWGSLNRTLGTGLAAQDPQAELQDPLMIVGPWRSGTTVLHELLSEATGLATPRSWQCMNACAFTLGKPPSSAWSRLRPMDTLEVHNNSPQEDEFALLTLGEASTYRAFLLPHRISEMTPLLTQDFWSERPQWQAAWEGFLRGVLHTTPSPLQPLLLKSPNHTYRLRSIVQRFPRVRLVWAMRDPVDVFQSNRKMWGAMFGMYGLSEPQRGALDRFLVNAIINAADAVTWCAQSMPREQLVAVSFDDLLVDPAAVISTACSRLGLQTDGHKLRQAIARLGTSRQERYGEPLPAGATHAIEALRLAYTRASASHGIDCVEPNRL